MKINNITVVQNNNVYSLFLPNQICVTEIMMPPDNTYLADMQALKYITKTLAVRWGVYTGENSKRGHRN